VQDDTLAARRRLYLLSRVVVARNFRRRLTLAQVAAAVSSSPRQVQRAYAQFGELSFHEDLRGRRLAAAAQLLAEQPAIPVATVARLVGYNQPAHFAAAFRRRFGLAPALFRARARAHRAQPGGRSRASLEPTAPTASTAPTATPSPRATDGSPARSPTRASRTSRESVSAPARRTRISVP
jgi:AraC family transcriptional regulator, regulatory protein of adaptative response / methylphosphotriester-DNA alkyltransferase methyltransferase